MAITVIVHYNGGLLPDIVLLTLCYYHRGTAYDLMHLTKRFDMFPPVWDAQV